VGAILRIRAALTRHRRFGSNAAGCTPRARPPAIRAVQTSHTMLRVSDPRVRRLESSVAAALDGPCRVPSFGDSGDPCPLVVAVSGGPDSLALLHALVRVPLRRRGRASRRPFDLRVAYFDHRLREPAQVAAERQFVERQAAALGLPFVAGSGDVRGAARRGGRSIEDAARRCRYAFLAEAAAEAGAAAVAVGHTATDQAETVLLRVLRGTGVAGLGAMDWRSRWPLPGPGPALLRPLLGVLREDTVAYCAALGLEPRQDPENDSLRYRRNRVRHELLPVLRRYNPRIITALTGLAQSARETQSLVSGLVDARWADVVRTEAGAVRFICEPLAAVPAPVRAEMLRRAVAMLGDEPLPLARERLHALEALIRGGRGRVIELPGGLRAEVRRDSLWIERGQPLPQALDDEWVVNSAGTTAIPGWRIRLEWVVAARARGEPFTAWFRPDVFAQPVVVTGRRRGDRMQPSGLGGRHKKLQDLLVDARVPASTRDAVPVVRSAAGIIWLVGVRTAGWAEAAAEEPAVRMEFRSSTAPVSDWAERRVDE
jgi:tRNA(Ile)-lysidine synthetase-like protein